MHYIFAGVEFVEVVEPCASCERGVSKMRLPLGEHSIRLGDNEECLLACCLSAWCEFEASGEVVDCEDEVAALFRGGKVAFESAARRVEQFWVVRFVRAEFGKAGEGARLEFSSGNASWRGIARVNESELVGAHLRCDRAWNRERVVVVFEREDS